jgi:hypothetical protein
MESEDLLPGDRSEPTPQPFSRLGDHIAAAWEAMTANTVEPDLRVAAFTAPIIGLLTFLGLGRHAGRRRRQKR